MYLVISGEGPGDIGTCLHSEQCAGDDFREGPMSYIIDQLIETFQGYEMSHLSTDRVHFVSESYLSRNKSAPKKKSMDLKGKKRPAETKFYFENARALAAVARAKQIEVQDNVIAILFRDSDGTASAGRGDWSNKRNSMLAGFQAENFMLGVAMVPKPKSEAWLLCATKEAPYQHCAALEEESGNDNAGRISLKEWLNNSLKGDSTTDALNQQLINRKIDIHQINMPSFNTFKNDLKEVVGLALQPIPKTP